MLALRARVRNPRAKREQMNLNPFYGGVGAEPPRKRHLAETNALIIGMHVFVHMVRKPPQKTSAIWFENSPLLPRPYGLILRDTCKASVRNLSPLMSQAMLHRARLHLHLLPLRRLRRRQTRLSRRRHPQRPRRWY